MKKEFEQIVQALKTARIELDSTIPICQGLANAITGDSFVCTGCPAMISPKHCGVQEFRDLIQDLLVKAK